VLYAQGKVEEALGEWEKAIAISPDQAEAQCNMGRVLEQQGRLAEALPFLQRGHELLSRRPHNPYPSAQWAQDCRRLLELQGRLPDLLTGNLVLSSAAERIEYATLRSTLGRHVVAARLYAEAFEAEPKPANDLQADHRYDSACAAVRAGCGERDAVSALDAASALASAGRRSAG
jgi:tetratricopeptide (TPR) repeat protein